MNGKWLSLIHILYNLRSGSVIVAPSHKNVRFGYVFRNCIVDGNAAAADGKQKLGRPWHNSPRAVYMHTTMRIPLAPEGWTNMGAIPGLFAEYDSRDAEGNVLDLSQRKTEYDGRGPDNPQMCIRDRPWDYREMIRLLTIWTEALNWWRKRKIRRAWCISCETTRSYCLI